MVMNDTLIHVVGSSKSRMVSKKIKPIHVSLIQSTVCHLGALALVDVRLSLCPRTRSLMSLSLAGYHTGKYSFDIFTHLRSTLDNPALFVLSRCLG